MNALIAALWDAVSSWEGGEGKITTQYTISLLRWQNSAWHQKNMNRQRKLLKKALVYPENLGEGKLEGTKDNHLFYHLGLALEAQGKHDEAKHVLRLRRLNR